MADFKIGCSPLTSKIYAGNVLKNGTWGHTKYDVTETAPQAVAQHLLQLDESIEFAHNNGKTYRLQVVEVRGENPSNENGALPIPDVSDTVCCYCKERPALEPLWICKECMIAYNKEKQTGR